VSRGNGDDQDDGEKDAPAAGEPTGLEAVAQTPADEIASLRRELAELRDQILRKRAEFENYRRRTDRDRNQAFQDGAAAVLKGLVPTLDNLDRALAAEVNDSPLKQGVELIRRDLAALLDAQGVVVEDPLGKPFDPLRHQALSHEPAPGVAEDTVIGVFSKGYALKDRLLRPAMVKVAGPPEDAGGAPADEKVH
jgi:molecular chaperone GrpE